MFALRNLAALALAATCLVPSAAGAVDDFTAALSSAPTAIKLCGDNSDDPIQTNSCKQAGYDQLISQIDTTFAAALANTPANIKPPLKRDQFWFNEMIIEAAQNMQLAESDGDKESFADLLRLRAAMLKRIADGFGRAGLEGKWENVFGSITITSSDGGGLRIAIDTRAIYGSGPEKQRLCQAAALVRPADGGWLSGTILPEKEPAAASEGAGAKPVPPPGIKIRRQGETLRVVLSGNDWDRNAWPHCGYIWQVTGSYFASGKADGPPMVTAEAAFVAPTFDCTRPNTASEEEICSDPELADNDQRLNRAWKDLLPRLDTATRRMLTDDQRHWMRTQAFQYPEFLHPAWNKTSSDMHDTTYGRDRVASLQRERIALLEGFDEHRRGLVGLWLGYTAVLKVTQADDGSLKAQGGKWFQGDWKGGCTFAISGRVVNGEFRSDEKRKNPDTLERDHASLIVNRLDDAAAAKRDGRDESSDEPKCNRSYTISSTARLFPVRPSPEIDVSESEIR